MRFAFTALIFHLIVLVLSSPTPFSATSHRVSVTDGEEEPSTIAVPDLYETLPLPDVPTTFEKDMVLSRSSEARYGYQFGRPLDNVFKVMNSPAGFVLKPLFGNFINDTVCFQHWGILISVEPPFSGTNTTTPQGRDSLVPSPETGTVFELRNSENTGLIYLDVKKWENYGHRPAKVKYLGTLNRTDIELVDIGRTYIQHVGREGFHNFYRNCQIFTTWYARALWPMPDMPTRTDQLFGKFLWWFKDWKKTAKWGWKKFSNFLGVSNCAEEVDSSADFVPIDTLLQFMNQTKVWNVTDERPRVSGFE